MCEGLVKMHVFTFNRCEACVKHIEGKIYMFGLSYNDIFMEMTVLEKGCLNVDLWLMLVFLMYIASMVFLRLADIEILEK